MIVKRKAAGTLEVQATGTPAHSGSAPQKGRSALLALAAVAQRVAARSDPAGPDRLTAVPTILSSGEAFNVVPPRGRAGLRPARGLAGGLRARCWRPCRRSSTGSPIESTLVRAWPGMDTRAATAFLLDRAAARLGRPLVAAERGGASDASHIAQAIPLTVDGLGPRGGGAHAPHEWVGVESLRTRAEVALAVAAAILEG